MKSNTREQHILYYINIQHPDIRNQVMTHAKYKYLYRKSNYTNVLAVIVQQ